MNDGPIKGGQGRDEKNIMETCIALFVFALLALMIAVALGWMPWISR